MGINKYDRGSHQFTHYQRNPENPNTLSDNLVSSFFEDENQILWVGTRNGGLNKFDRNNNLLSNYKSIKKNSLSSTSITAIKPDGKAAYGLVLKTLV